MKNKTSVEFSREFIHRLEGSAAKRKYSMEQLMTATGLMRKTFCNWYGGSIPNTQTLLLVTKTLNITFDYLLQLTDQIYPEYLPKEYYDLDEILFSVKCRCEDILEEENLTVSELCNKTGLYRSTFMTWLNGTKLPNPQNLMMLCKPFGLSTDYLLGLTEEKFLPSFR